jgi:hypothetical protein
LRTATEQLLVSDAIDQAVTQVDFRTLKGKSVFLDTQYVDAAVVDKGYLISSIRQHLLATGCVLQEDRSKATYVVELRSGGIGTDRHDLLFGVPAMNIPTFLFAAPGLPAQTPEIPLAKRTKQLGVAKIGVFAYNRTTGHPVWQSGVAQSSSYAKHVWVFGAGPFQRGSFRDGTQIAGAPISLPLLGAEQSDEHGEGHAVVPVTQQATWSEPPAILEPPAQLTDKPASAAVQAAAPPGAATGPVTQASQTTAAAPASPAPAPAAAPAPALPAPAPAAQSSK